MNSWSNFKRAEYIVIYRKGASSAREMSKVPNAPNFQAKWASRCHELLTRLFVIHQSHSEVHTGPRARYACFIALQAAVLNSPDILSSLHVSIPVLLLQTLQYLLDIILLIRHGTQGRALFGWCVWNNLFKQTRTGWTNNSARFPKSGYHTISLDSEMSLPTSGLLAPCTGQETTGGKSKYYQLHILHNNTQPMRTQWHSLRPKPPFFQNPLGVHYAEKATGTAGLTAIRGDPWRSVADRRPRPSTLGTGHSIV